MSEHFPGNAAANNNMAFPLVIAITALILALISGVVNYRQNNLSNLESSLRDTKDQLQLAKNDMTDIRIQTLQQLVDADMAVKNEGQLKQKNAKLTDRLKESAIRMGELESQIRRMDHKITAQASDLRAAKRKINKVASQKKVAKKASKNNSSAVSHHAVASNALASIDVYVDKMSSSQRQGFFTAVKDIGFKPNHLKLLASMSLSANTTVFYYDDSYKAIARNLANALKAHGKSDVTLRKGASAYAKNKIIVHLIGQ